MSRSASPSTDHGFTLIEVLVALFIMAILATMSWQGIDGLIRTRDGAQASTEASLRLATVLTQWEQDLQQIQVTPAAPPIKFDSLSLRLIRQHPQGLQLVIWTRQERTLYRWASPPVTQTQGLQDWWIRSADWSAIGKQALPMLTDVDSFQVYFFRKGDNNWSNAQSSGNAVTPANPAASGAQDDSEEVPAGVRLQLKLPRGNLTRDVMARAG